MTNITNIINHDICLNMIVKNEGHVIRNTLEHLCSIINFSYYVISDTGSTDDTINIIQTFFDEKNIKGEISIDEWKDFGYNRTVALEKAYNKTKYLFIFDADDKIIGDFKMPDKLISDAYHLKFGGGVSYKRLLLINNQLKWKFVGVLHEFLVCIDKPQNSSDLIEGNYFVESGKTGDRSKDPEKYKKDAMILENAFYECEKNNDNLKVRYSFYCAQSYRDNDNHAKAIEWYKKRVSLKDWPQEVYFSCLMIGRIYYYNLNQPEMAIYYWSLGIEADIERYETLFEIISHFRKTGNPYLAYQYYKMIPNVNITSTLYNDKLFIATPIYEYLLFYELTIILCYVNKHSDAIPIYNKLFNYALSNSMPYEIKTNILENFDFYINHIKNDNFNIENTKNYFNFVKQLYYERNELNSRQISSINKVILKIRKLGYDNTNIIDKLVTKTNKNNKIKVMLSITTCKRYDLFTATMNSFLKNCLDIEMIDYFFCVDDNSSEEDRKNMEEKYPFFNYYFKTEEEKGHLKSMNIIWDKLSNYKPTYWIHLEDDWLFFKPINYIQRSILFLEDKNNKDNKIHQILFNKNYGELLENYNLVGGHRIDGECLLHIKDEPNLFGANSAYWPHYSFRPSMILVNTILKLGNYDSENNFFERDYADKWHAAEYKSAYFNEITCIHIGRLTSERNGNKNNAYSLNNEQQFNNLKSINIQNSVDNTENKPKFDSNSLDPDIKYVFLEKLDHIGDDICYKGIMSPEENLKLCDELNDCIAFNTLGYFKHSIDIDNLVQIPIFGEKDGLFLNVKKYKEKYGL